MFTATPTTAVTDYAGQSDRREIHRTPTIFTLLYSGMDSGQILMGEGVVTNLSANGIGIRGNLLVKPGMELTLFVDLPGIEEPLCIAQSRVSWVDGRRFGAVFGDIRSEDMNHLRFFWGDRNTPSRN